MLNAVSITNSVKGMRIETVHIDTHSYHISCLFFVEKYNILLVISLNG